MTENNCRNCPRYKHFNECPIRDWDFSIKVLSCWLIKQPKFSQTDIFLTKERGLSIENIIRLKVSISLNRN